MTNLYENIVPHLSAIVSLSEQEINLFLKKLRPKNLQAGEYLLRNGDVSRQVAFVNAGLMRYYFIKDGEEYIGQFFFKNTWVADYFSFLTQSPSEMFIQAIEDTELLTLGYEEMQTLYREAPVFEKFGRLIAENIYIATHRRNNSLLRESPEERYLNLIQERPKVVERIPQYMIASYLGIKPESLSRIRKRIWQNKNRS